MTVTSHAGAHVAGHARQVVPADVPRRRAAAIRRPTSPRSRSEAVDTTGNTKAPTMRETLEMHRTNPTCATCHQIFEPMGLALENFDAVGRGGRWTRARRSMRRGVMPRRHEDRRRRQPARRRWCATRISSCASSTEKLLTYALGRGVEYQDMPLVRSIVRDAAASKYRFSSLVMGDREERSVPDESRKPPTPQHATCDAGRLSYRGPMTEARHMFLTKKHIPAANRSAWRGRHAGAAVARCDGARRPRRWRRRPRASEAAIRRLLRAARHGAGLLGADKTEGSAGCRAPV